MQLYYYSSVDLTYLRNALIPLASHLDETDQGLKIRHAWSAWSNGRSCGTVRAPCQGKLLYSADHKTNKILKYHPNMDMGPLFEWGMEEEDEQNLKALPYVINWFERARVAVADEEEEQYKVDGRKLSAIFQYFNLQSICHCCLGG